MGDSFDHFTTGIFTWNAINIHSILNSKCELINDPNRLSWGTDHHKHLTAINFILYIPVIYAV